MSHLTNSYPIGGWTDPGGFPEVTSFINKDGKTEWWGYFGRNIKNADQESFFVAFDQADDEFNGVNEVNEATLCLPILPTY